MADPSGVRLPSRRGFLAAGVGGGALAIGGVVAGGAVLGVTACSSDSPATAATIAATVAAQGARQAGVTSPAPPQPNLLLAVYDVNTSDVGQLLADLGRAVLALTGANPDPRLAGIAPGDLTITIGIGPRLVVGVDPTLPGATELPTFEREAIADATRGGDLVVQVCASDPLLLPLALGAVANTAGTRVTEQWRQRAARGPYVDVSAGLKAPRNVIGFVDGIVGPNTPADQDADIWINAPSKVVNSTIMVLRRMTIDLGAFTAQPLAAQEAAIGRRRPSGAPISGGTIATSPDLGAKTATGGYVIAADAHLRRANALSIGVDQMLRRSYSIDDPSAGLIFISFQHELRTFTATLTHMQEMDALFAFTTSTASGTFLVLPGFTADRPLGSTLFGA